MGGLKLGNLPLFDDGMNMCPLNVSTVNFRNDRGGFWRFLSLFLIGLLISSFIVSPAWSGSGDEGSTSGVFLKMDPSAKSSAFGSAYTARPAGVLSSYFNPAGLGDQRRYETAFTNMDFVAGIGYNYLGVAFPVERVSGGLGISVTNLDYGRQNRTEISGNNPITGLGSFSASDKAFSVSYGTRISPRWMWGANGKWVQSSLASEDASTFAADLGVMYFSGIKGLSAGVSVRNMFGDLTFDRESDPLPRLYDFGIHYTMPLGTDNEHRFNSAVSFVKPNDADNYGKVGTEFVLNNTFALRMGYKGSQEADDGWTFGGGLTMNSFSIDYSYTPTGVLGDQQRLSLKYEFGGD